MALLTVTFLVANDDTACEDLHIALPVLRHLRIDSRTLLEQKWSALFGTDCSNPHRPTSGKNGGHLGRLLVARMQRAGDEPSKTPAADRPRINFYDNRNSVDSFPDPYLIHPSDNIGGDTENRDEIQALLDRARTEKIPERY